MKNSRELGDKETEKNLKKKNSAVCASARKRVMKTVEKKLHLNKSGIASDKLACNTSTPCNTHTHKYKLEQIELVQCRIFQT